MTEELENNELESTEEDSHELVGLPDGHVDENGDTVVYEYDEDGNFAGWHKEAGA